MLDKKVSIYQNIKTVQGSYITLKSALERIKNGRSRETVERLRIKVTEYQELRNKITPDESYSLEISKVESEIRELKNSLPSICFSGVFAPTRSDQNLIEHSSLLILDIDHCKDWEKTFENLKEIDGIYAIWRSPSGDGIKALLIINDPKKHREHYQAICKELPILDTTSQNESRVCFESYDPDMWINEEPGVYTKFVELKKEVATNDETFKNLVRWLEKKGEYFVSGKRNAYIYKLSAACCNFGMSETDCMNNCNYQFISGDFSKKEILLTVKSAYKRSRFGVAKFEKDVLIINGEESVIEDVNEEDFLKDIVFASEVYAETEEIYDNGYPEVRGIGIPELDDIFKPKKREITLSTGYGNHGKTEFELWYFVFRAILYGEKLACFSPEHDTPAEFYLKLAEIYLGCSMLPSNPKRASKEKLKEALTFVNKHFFLVSPKDIKPEPEYIKKKFARLIAEKNVDGILIDPFNQLANDYGNGNVAKYLETFLSDFKRFCKDNDVYGRIIAHPVKAVKNKDGSYPCPDVFDVADGAMWNNKMDDIFVVFRPEFYTNYESTLVELHAKKVKKQWKAKRGVVEMNYSRYKKRYLFNNIDYMEKALKNKGIEVHEVEEEFIKPLPVNHNFDTPEEFQGEIPF